MTTSAETVGVYGVMKSGWLHRQSDFLRRWKRSFCVLHRDGRFEYFTNESQREVEGTLNLRNCYAIKIAHQVGETPPNNLSTQSLFEVKTPENIIVFCADTSDDAQAWKASMEEAKSATSAPSGTTTTYYSSATAPSGTTTTYYSSAPPPYAATAQPYTAPPPPPYTPVAGQTVTTTTTYPNGRRVIVQQNGATATPHNGLYPVQSTAYGYPGQTVYTTYGANPAGTVVQPGQTQHTIIYDQRRRNNMDGLATGAVAGAAVGSMMMMPLLFW